MSRAKKNWVKKKVLGSQEPGKEPPNPEKNHRSFPKRTVRHETKGSEGKKGGPPKKPFKGTPRKRSGTDNWSRGQCMAEKEKKMNVLWKKKVELVTRDVGRGLGGTRRTYDVLEILAVEKKERDECGIRKLAKKGNRKKKRRPPPGARLRTTRVKKGRTERNFYSGRDHGGNVTTEKKELRRRGGPEKSKKSSAGKKRKPVLADMEDGGKKIRRGSGGEKEPLSGGTGGARR